MAQFGDFTVDRNSTKYVLGSGGTIISYATDEPAFEFNADGSYKGLLVEPAATNLSTYSEDFSTTWTPLNATITTNDTTAPDGNTTADKLVESAATASRYVYKTSGIGVSAGVYSGSVYAKAAERSRLILALWSGANYELVQFDLSNGTVVQEAVSGIAAITDAGGGWYRCSVKRTLGAVTTYLSIGPYLNADIGGSLTGGFPSYAGDDTSGIYIWGAQVETGPIATSYIPTTTASVTRNADNITQTSASSLIGQTEGTLYVEVDWKTASGTDQYLLSVSDGTTSNWLLIYKATTGNLNMYAVADGNNKTNQGESSSAYSGIQKFAFAYAEDDFELYRNGSIVGTADTSGSLASLATLTDIDLGQSPTAFEQANLHIRAVALFTRRLSGTDLGALTTL